MTRYSFFKLMFTLIVLTITYTASASGNHESATTVNHIQSSAPATSDEPISHDMSHPILPSAKPVVPHGHKTEAPKMEELPHIHHFHKERVKKSKRHHQKFWILSKIILVLCHLMLLVIAYMHVTH